MQLGAKSAQDPRQGHRARISAREERSQGKNRVTHGVSNPVIHTGAEEEELSMGTYSYRDPLSMESLFLNDILISHYYRSQHMWIFRRNMVANIFEVYDSIVWLFLMAANFIPMKNLIGFYSLDIFEINFRKRQSIGKTFSFCL